jgi:hypothetical protein
MQAEAHSPGLADIPAKGQLISIKVCILYLAVKLKKIYKHEMSLFFYMIQ